MIYYKTDEEIELMRESALLVCRTHTELVPFIKPGVTGLELDKIAEEFLRDNKAIPSFKGYSGFPNSLCISINEVVVHGIPHDKPLKDGDIISVDCGALLNGFHGDVAYTYPIGNITEEHKQLLKVTKESLELGVEQAIAGNRIGDISAAVQNHAEKFGYGVVRELVGHGLGRSLHEEPEVPNFGKKGFGKKMKENLVIAIEPMINLGTRKIKQLSDGWTISTADNQYSAHYEHDVVIKKGTPYVLSDYVEIEKAIKNNPEISEIQ